MKLRTRARLATVRSVRRPTVTIVGTIMVAISVLTLIGRIM